MSIHPYFDRMHIPPQVAEEVSPRLTGVVVVPCRGSNKLFAFLSQLEASLADVSAWEVVVVWYASNWDEETVMQENMQQLLQLEHFKRLHPDLAIHGLSFQHLPDHQADALAIKLAMDEAAYRLELARQPQGPIVLWSADYALEGDLLLALQDLPIREELWLLHTESDIVQKERYHMELSHLYWQMGLHQACYPHQFPVNTDMMICRQSAYLIHQGLAGESMSELSKLQFKAQIRQQCGYIAAVKACGPLVSSPAAPSAVSGDWIPVDWFKELADFQQQWERLPTVERLTGFNQWLLSLPQPFVAFLTEQRFPVTWLALRQGARSIKALERELYSWWSPERVQQMVRDVVPLYYRPQPPAKAVAMLLEWMQKVPCDNWELNFQVQTLRGHYQQAVGAIKKASPV